MRLTYLNTIILSIPYANTTGIQISVIWGVYPPHKNKKKKSQMDQQIHYERYLPAQPPTYKMDCDERSRDLLSLALTCARHGRRRGGRKTRRRQSGAGGPRKVGQKDRRKPCCGPEQGKRTVTRDKQTDGKIRPDGLHIHAAESGADTKRASS